MHKDMQRHFNSQISSEARKVTSIGRNGYDVRGQRWGEAYSSGKVTSKDDRQIKSAAASSRNYIKSKYGESAYKAMAGSGVLGRPIQDFNPKVSPEVVLAKKYLKR